MNVLEIDRMSFSYRADRPLLDNISLCLQDGDIFCLLGPNGSGKTTFISQVLFPNKMNRERIKAAGTAVSQMTLPERAKLFGYVPQKIPFPHISVMQTVLMGRYPHSEKIMFGPSAADREIAHDALEQLGIERYAERQLNTLSGGEIQRVFIAQSIAKQAKIYFFDEPMSALDPEYQSFFLKMLLWLSQRGAAIVFTTHDPNHLFSLKAKTRVGIIGSDHRFKEVDIEMEDGLREIEDAYNGAISISFLEREKKYVACFKV